MYMIFFPIISYNIFRFLFFTFRNILKIHIKNHSHSKSFSKCILKTICHLDSISFPILSILCSFQLPLFNLYLAPCHRHHSPIPHISLPLSRFTRCPTTAHAPTPPPSLPQRTRARTPSPTAAARTPPRQRVPPPTFLFLFLLHAWQQHIRICAANRARQSTH
jgi:hypothetical protein